MNCKIVKINPGDKLIARLPKSKYLTKIDAVFKNEDDPVSPNHYTCMKISPLEYIKANGLGWNAGNVIKYVSRYKNKNGLEDLRKAKWYLEDLIKDVEAGK